MHNLDYIIQKIKIPLTIFIIIQISHQISDPAARALQPARRPPQRSVAVNPS